MEVIVNIVEDIVTDREVTNMGEKINISKKNQQDLRSYQRTKMKKEMVLQKLKQAGCRITKQRQILLDIILEENCSYCKEIYYKAIKIDDRIGPATVYRMVKVLEEIGAINRKNMYKISSNLDNNSDYVCTIVFDDQSVMEVSSQKWNQIIQTGLKACGYMNDKKIQNVVA